MDKVSFKRISKREITLKNYSCYDPSNFTPIHVKSEKVTLISKSNDGTYYRAKRNNGSILLIECSKVKEQIING